MTAQLALTNTPARESVQAHSTRPVRLTLLEGGVPKPRRNRHGLTVRESALAFACGMLLMVALVIGSVASDALTTARVSRALSELGTETLTVREGDTLWAIASERVPEGVTTAQLVSWIEETNDLDGGLIVSGQKLEVPVIGQAD